MAKIAVETYEQYPAYSVLSAPDDLSPDEVRLYEVDEATLARWDRIAREHAQMRTEIDRLVNPRCPECDHPQFRHQEFSAGWDYWGCLEKVPSADGSEFARHTCRCQHGKPAGR